MIAMAPEKLERIRRNEKRKRQCDYFNGVAISLFGAGFVTPIIAFTSGRGGWPPAMAAFAFLCGSYAMHRLCLRQASLLEDANDAV